MLHSWIRRGALIGAVGLGACSLEVQNPNDPETDRLLRTPADVEALLGSQYLRWHTGLYGVTSGGIEMMAWVLSFETFSSLANNGMGSVISVPRGPLDNTVGNGNAGLHRRVYYIPSEVARTTSNTLARLDAPLFTLGNPPRDARARAFAEFVRGIALGYVALFYDSAAVITPALGPEDPGELVGYNQVMAAALDALQTAIDVATSAPAGPEGFPIPNAWLPTPTSLTSAEFIRLVRSYRARLRANVARTPTERAAVDWDAVIADAQNGITANHLITTNTVTGPSRSAVRQVYSYATWHQMTPFIAGMADTSGSYAAWIALPFDQRGADGIAFFLATPDLRWPQGATRAAQQADLALPCPTVPCKRYFRNRASGNDQLSGAAWGWSNYDHVRFHPWHLTGDAGLGGGGNGNIPVMTKAEIDLLEAEGHFQKGNYAAAAALINKTRTVAGLPAITVFDATSPVPGGNACVPKVPVGPTYNTIACGNMMEALKWEKRMETMYTHFAAWFLDHRGWGSLPEGTGYHWAPPFEDLLARGRSVGEIYSTGGLGTGFPGAAARSTYGW